MKKQLFNLQTSLALLFLMFGMFCLQAQVQMDLPVNFEGVAFEYGVIGFDGADASTIEVDPTDATNTVVKVIKSNTAQTWAGTTVTAPAGLGFATPIPFTATQTQMSVRVWSPDAGIVVRLKVEKHNVPTMSVETDAISTVANGWETLIFDFANEGTGTAALNLSSIYDKASIFFNYGVNGATAGEKTYYFDDVEVYQPAVPTDLVITTTVCTTANQVRLTGPFWNWDPNGGPVAVNNGNGTWTFTLSPAPTANMEYLLVVDGVQENLVSAMVNGGTCAPVTDYSTYANRIWTTTDPLTVSNTYGQCVACTPPPPTDLVITTTVCTTANEVRLTGPFWNWDPNGGPVAVNNGNGTWTFTLSPAPTANMEYLLVVDGVQENLVSAMVNGGTCAPVTDYSTYANRIWTTTDPLTVSNTYGQCVACVTNNNLLITVDVCSTTANEVRMTGPFWNWDPTAGPFAVDNGNGTWTFTFSPAPTADMEYLVIVNGVQENLISDMQNGGTCAPVTDYFAYANRKWIVGSGDVNIAYDRCVPCSYPDLIITTEICDSANSVNLTGPIWQWNPAFGPQAVNNGNGTWTFTISPAPTDTLEYLLVKNGTVENLIQEMVNGGGCAPITDYSTYANRRWLLGQGDVANTYGKCGSCIVGIDETSFENLMVYPNPSAAIFTVSNNTQIEKVTLYSIIGEKVLEKSIQSTTSTLDLSAMAAGIYHLNIQVGGETKTIQLIKE